VEDRPAPLRIAARAASAEEQQRRPTGRTSHSVQRSHLLRLRLRRLRQRIDMR
jgi:hypothetical protein